MTPRDPPIRAGVIGFGLAGRIFHAAVIDAVPGLELAAIVQRNGTAAAEAYPQVRIVASVEDLLADDSIRLVTVATPNKTHHPIARQCLLAGRNVVIDKPFALSSSEAADLLQLARDRNLLLSVYQNRRWDGDFLTLQRLLASGDLGRIASYESHFDRFRPGTNSAAWRESGEPGGGLLFDLGPHLIDQAVVLFGLPQALSADVRIERPGGRMDDAFDLCLRYPEMRAWLRVTCVAAMPGPRYMVNGTAGSYRKFGLDPQEDTLRSGDLFASSPWGVEPEERWGTLTRVADGHTTSERVPTLPGDYRGYYANIRDALLGRTPLAVTPLQAWRTMRMLELALESSERRCTLACDWSSEP